MSAMQHEILKTNEPIEKYSLGNDLELWKVHVGMLKEQTLNARSMASEMFLQLTDTVKRGSRLESLPFCALTEVGLEIVSGHHRIRAARKADVAEIWVLVDISGLSRDKIRAKQLAHNSIQGQDNVELIRQIFQQIDDVEARIEAYVDVVSLDDLAGMVVTLTSKDLEVEFDTKCVAINFLPVQFKEFEYAMKLLEGSKPDVVYLAARSEYEELIQAMDKVVAHYNIRSTPTIFAKMAQIVIEQIEGQDGETKT